MTLQPSNRLDLNLEAIDPQKAGVHPLLAQRFSQASFAAAHLSHSRWIEVLRVKRHVLPATPPGHGGHCHRGSDRQPVFTKRHRRGDNPEVRPRRAFSLPGHRSGFCKTRGPAIFGESGDNSDALIIQVSSSNQEMTLEPEPHRSSTGTPKNMEGSRLPRNASGLLFLVLLARSLMLPCLALELEPRQWSHLPVGANFGGVGFAYTTADIAFDPVLLIEDAEMDLKTWAGKYIRTFGLFEKSARIDLTQAYHQGEWSGLLDGVPASVTRNNPFDAAVM